MWHTGNRPSAIEVGLFRAPKASNLTDVRFLVKHDQPEAALLEYAFDRNVLLSGHK
jgi:hypothetical protein